MTDEKENKEIEAQEIGKLKPDTTFPINDLMRVGEIVCDKFLASKAEMHKRDIDFEREILSAGAKQNRLIIIGSFIISGLILTISAYLIVSNKENAALEIIKLIAIFGGGMFGGYGLGVSRQRKTEQIQE